MTKRLHGGRTTEQYVRDLQKNGWQVANRRSSESRVGLAPTLPSRDGGRADRLNIASIAGVSAQTVREILRRKNIIMD